MSQWISDRDHCRTAPATQGLLKIWSVNVSVTDKPKTLLLDTCRQRPPLPHVLLIHLGQQGLLPPSSCSLFSLLPFFFPLSPFCMFSFLLFPVLLPPVFLPSDFLPPVFLPPVPFFSCPSSRFPFSCSPFSWSPSSCSPTFCSCFSCSSLSYSPSSFSPSHKWNFIKKWKSLKLECH
jgi:hypothetical protein